MKLRLTTVFLLAFIINAIAQDPEFSMPNSSPLYLNPAMAGAEMCPRLAINYRNQWPAIGTFQTATFSADKHFNSIRGGLGLLYTYDVGGVAAIKSQSFRMMYAANINLGEKVVLRPAAYFGYSHKYLNTDELVFGDMVDPRYEHVFDSTITQLPNSSVGFVDIGIGAVLKTNRLLISLAADHLNQPDEGFFGTSKLPVKLKAYAQYNYEFGAVWSLNPQLLYAQQQDFQQIVPIAAFTYKQTVRFGAGVRFNTSNADAVIGMLGVDLGRFTIQYSYDYTVSALAGRTGGSHECGVKYTFGCKKDGEVVARPYHPGF